MSKNITTENRQIAVVKADELTEDNFQEKIRYIRNKQVLLDFDLAKFYGYTTKAFNQQVKNNLKKFAGEDFMFQLTEEEASRLRSNFLTIDGNRGKYFKYAPYAFTEQGIYMLMTVLRGDKAIEQSRTLVMLFKKMKDYILNSYSLVSETVQNSRDILELKTDMKTVKNELGEMIKRSEISPIALDFSKVSDEREFLFMDGEVVEAKDLLIKIYNKAKHKITIIDNYVSYNTLRLLLEIKQNLEVAIYTNNTNNYLNKTDIGDFQKERPDIKLKLMKTKNKVHDRFIILDDEKVFMLGASSKDIGNKVSMIHEVKETKIKNDIINLANCFSV